jgi:hypothetical protein
MLLDFHRKMESWSFCQTLGDVFLANVGSPPCAPLPMLLVFGSLMVTMT